MKDTFLKAAVGGHKPGSELPASDCAKVPIGRFCLMFTLSIWRSLPARRASVMFAFLGFLGFSCPFELVVLLL